MNHIDIYKESEKRDFLRKFNIEKSIEGTEAFEMNQDIMKGIDESEILEKARTGYYKDNAYNRKHGLVGKKYKKDPKEDEQPQPSSKKVGDIHEHNGKKYKKQANGNWLQISDHGMTKEEHKSKDKKRKLSDSLLSIPEYKKKYEEADKHKEQASKLSDKEHSDEEVGLVKQPSEKKEERMDLSGHSKQDLLDAMGVRAKNGMSESHPEMKQLQKELDKKSSEKKEGEKGDLDFKSEVKLWIDATKSSSSKEKRELIESAQRGVFDKIKANLSNIDDVDEKYKFLESIKNNNPLVQTVVNKFKDSLRHSINLKHF